MFPICYTAFFLNVCIPNALDLGFLVETSENLATARADAYFTDHDSIASGDAAAVANNACGDIGRQPNRWGVRFDEISSNCRS
ncbi:MAG: hypothetical protein AAGB46_12610 [Verrucomicrobiota bacterium]